MRNWMAIAAAAALSLASNGAQAAAIVSTTDPGGNLDNVLANACNGSLVQSGALTVQGCLNTNHDKIVDLTGDENMTYSGGQATVDSADGRFDDLRIAFHDGNAFSLLSLNVDAYKLGTVSFYGDTGSGDFLIGTMDLDDSGENRFYIYTTLDNEFLKYVRFEASLGYVIQKGKKGQPDIQLPVAGQNIADVKQIRIGGLKIEDTPDGNPEEVPEPAAVGLVGLGLAALALRRRKA